MEEVNLAMLCWPLFMDPQIFNAWSNNFFVVDKAKPFNTTLVTEAVINIVGGS